MTEACLLRGRHKRSRQPFRRKASSPLLIKIHTAQTKKHYLSPRDAQRSKQRNPFFWPLQADRHDKPSKVIWSFVIYYQRNTRFQTHQDLKTDSTTSVNGLIRKSLSSATTRPTRASPVTTSKNDFRLSESDKSPPDIHQGLTVKVDISLQLLRGIPTLDAAAALPYLFQTCYLANSFAVNVHNSCSTTDQTTS